jgi:hypothetical protein
VLPGAALRFLAVPAVFLTVVFFGLTAALFAGDAFAAADFLGARFFTGLYFR